MHSDCPDYDLCQNCEALPIAVHPTNHPMLKIKAPYTVIPTVYRVGQRTSIHASGSTTPTRSFTGPKADEKTHGQTSPETVGVTQDATPTPASAGLEMAVPTIDWLPSANQPSTSPPKATSMDPFADIFSVGPCLPAPPPLTRTETIGMTNPWPRNDTEREEFQRLIAELSGNTSPQRPKSEVDGPIEDIQMGFSERATLTDRLFGSEMPLHRPSTLPGALPEVVDDEPPAPVQIVSHPTIVPEAVDTVSDSRPLATVVSDSDPDKDDTKPIAEVSAVRESLASLIRDLPTLVPPPVSTSAEAKIDVPRISFLSAAFVEDVTVPDGQVFPPGAEFVKCWRLINDSGCEWPESTELMFLAGDSLSSSASVGTGNTVPVGRTGPGQTVDVWTGELKAPEVPGRYVGYWRLRADGELFGNSLWVE